MMTDYCIVLCTVPAENAEQVARALVDAGHAACVNIVPGLTSVYRWQGEIQTDAEQLLIIKTRQDRFAAVRDCIRAQHPYELPEIIAVPVVAGLHEYLSWINDSVTP